MEIPITGFVVHSNDSESEHSHQLFLTSWDGRPVNVHVHPFKGDTSFDVGHLHHGMEDLLTFTFILLKEIHPLMLDTSIIMRV